MLTSSSNFLGHGIIENVSVKLGSQYNWGKSISLAADMDKVDFKFWDLKVQLGQFPPTEDSKGVPFGKIIKTLKWFEKNDQKLFMSEVLKLAKLLLVMQTMQEWSFFQWNTSEPSEIQQLGLGFKGSPQARLFGKYK